MNDFESKKQITELFASIRKIEVGVVRALEFRNGLPFCMEVEDEPDGVDRTTSSGHVREV